MSGPGPKLDSAVVGIGQLGNTTATTNANIAQQNYLNSLYNQRADTAAWNSAAQNIGNINWSGLFGGGQASPDGQYSASGVYDPLGRY